MKLLSASTGLILVTGLLLGRDWTCTTSCLSALGPGYATCMKCVDAYALKVWPAAPPSYTLNVARLLAKQDTYISGWCGKKWMHPEEGVDTALHPSGWRPSIDANGNMTYVGCEQSTDYPSIGTVSYSSHAYVKEALKSVPRRFASGEIWRGNELGFIVASSVLWENTDGTARVLPRGLALGSLPNQHASFRPILDRLFGACDAQCAKDKMSSAARFLKSRNELRIPESLREWVLDELFTRSFPGETNPFDAKEFSETQDAFVKGQILTPLVPEFLGRRLEKSTIKTLQKYYQWLLPLTKKHYGKELEAQDCTPTPGGCADQLASGFLDAFLAAGGLSVPGAISTALWVLYGDVEPHGDTFPQGYVYSRESPLPFFYESMRFFAPVLGFPWWEKFPERTTDEYGSQFAGGQRVLLNIALADRDPNVWGKDAHKFRVRPMKEYHDKFIGFAETAIDNSVGGGKYNKACPAKTTALHMGKAFLKNFDQDEWELVGKQSEFFLMAPMVDEFVLQRKQQ
eukprot:TRINITY_DN8885_c0_g1_i1.p1 TRINITY_DN8885_c0_g1~~TRINITY_DN8885_c0_g1_i1.p1  ORF type:complete len:515 (+),score=222.70 TRINITY_DN8885_c0_g1_i1:87-1631(+)